MILGLLSDSHGRADTTRLAVSALCERGAELLIHLGDVGGEKVIEELAGHRAHVVFGNCDWDEVPLGQYAASLGLKVDHPIGRLTVDGKSIIFTHGHLPPLVSHAFAENPGYLLHGHTHELRDEKVGSTRVINPGALFRAQRYTAVLLDPGADRLEIITLPRR